MLSAMSIKFRPDLAIAAVSVAVGSALFAGTIAHAVWYAPEPQYAPASLAPLSAASAASTGAAAFSKATAPVRLRIPALSIDAKVQKVGLTKTGALGTPDNFTDVGWYRWGAKPGEQGNAVIDGHVDNGLDLAGVFKHLNEITPGADIYVDEADGTQAHYVVTDVESYPYHEVPMDAIFNDEAGARLMLITCDGGWVSGEDTYDHRLVVYAKLVS